MGICEEKSSGIDRVVQTAELFQLPAPDFREASSRTLVIICGPKKFDDMDREDRVRACYQHCALKWVMSERMTNQSLRTVSTAGEQERCRFASYRGDD
jgi:ATP-dependent DNA helicase RecG